MNPKEILKFLAENDIHIQGTDIRLVVYDYEGQYNVDVLAKSKNGDYSTVLYCGWDLTEAIRIFKENNS